MVEVVHPHRARLCELRLDAVPRGMLEVERDAERRVERAEQQREHTLVSRALQRDANRPESRAEGADALGEHVEPAQTVTGQLRYELEPVRHLLGPAAELVLCRQPVSRRVELDGGKRSA
jgi:hypothetical protein